MAAPGRVRGTDRLWWIIATGGGLGLSPFAPGTVGSLPGLLLTLGLLMLPGWPLRIATWLACTAVAIAAAHRGERFFGRKDPGQVVADEIISLPLTLAFVAPTAAYVAIGFLLNRALDILKPFPARRSQKLPGGWGIVIDDVISGLYAGGILWALQHYAGAAITGALPAWMAAPLLDVR